LNISLADKEIEKAYQDVLPLLLGAKDHIQKEKLGKYSYYDGIREGKLRDKNFKEFLQEMQMWIMKNETSIAEYIEAFRKQISEHKKGRSSEGKVLHAYIALIQQPLELLQQFFIQDDVVQYLKGEDSMIKEESFMDTINTMVWYIMSLEEHVDKLLKCFQEDVGEKKYESYVEKERLLQGYHESN
jgi:hypothetical protein